ncbi:MAG: hypothetical protein IH886_05255 [Nitrospinae bacterium]|nr:hypothetical protein [Nitrospinota bacterium]
MWYTLDMSPVVPPKPFKLFQALAITVWAVAGMVVCSADVAARENLLELSTRSQVTAEGKVTLFLTLTNHSREPLFHLHPMFHFHHTRSPMPMIPRLGPGESLTLENKKHPPVRRVGSYPVVAMVQYQESEKAAAARTSLHTDSFYFEQPKVSKIEGKIGAEVEEGASRVKILLKNPSPSFKNVRMILLLPPGLVADRFQGMKGFTLLGGEEKYFEVPVHQVGGRKGGVYPIHLLVEYGEMLNHYSGEITGEINFGPVFGQGAFWPQMLVFLFLAVTLFLALQKRFAPLKFR